MIRAILDVLVCGTLPGVCGGAAFGSQLRSLGRALLAWWGLPPVQWLYARQYRRADRRAFAAEAAARLAYYPRHDGSVVVGDGDEVLVRPVNGRDLGTMPRLATPDAPPWDTPTAQQPAVAEREADDDDDLGPEMPIARPFVPEAARFPHCEHCEGGVCARPYHRTPCADGCNEAEPLAERMIA